MDDSTTSLNPPGVLYKYVSPSTALAVLGSKTLRWSSPARFNDPFDLGWDIENGVTVAELDVQLVHELDRLVFDDSKVPLDRVARRMRPIVQRFREMARVFPRVSVYRDLEEEIGVDLLNERGPLAVHFERKWQELLSRLRIVCLSELPDSILMWSHYAEAHSGAVLGFRRTGAISNPLSKALKVSYEKNVPCLVTANRWARFICYDEKLEDADHARRILATKCDAWEYEKEWRVTKQIDGRGRANGSLFEDVPFQFADLTSVHFGCRSSPAFMSKVCALLGTEGSHIKVFQFRMAPRRFALECYQVPEWASQPQNGIDAASPNRDS